MAKRARVGTGQLWRRLLRGQVWCCRPCGSVPRLCPVSIPSDQALSRSRPWILLFPHLQHWSVLITHTFTATT